MIKTISLQKNDYNILAVIALTSLNISKNLGSASKDISFFIKPLSDISSTNYLDTTHYKNDNVIINNIEYSFLINYSGQKGITVKNIKIDIPALNGLRVSGSGSYAYSYTHDIREFTPYVTLFLTGYGLVRGNNVDIRLSQSAITKTDMVISIASSGDSSIYQVNVCVVFSRFMTSE